MGPLGLAGVLSALECWRRDANGVCAAGADLLTGYGTKIFAEAKLHSGQVVVAAADGEAVAGDGRIGFKEQAQDGGRGYGDLAIEAGELTGDPDAVNRLAPE